MTNHRNPLYCVRWMSMLALATAWLFMPFLLRAQSYGPWVDACNYNAVDWSNDLEQTVCLTGDSSELDVFADTDSWAYDDGNRPSGDLYVVGLGAQGQLLDGQGNLVADTGMAYSGPYGDLVQAGDRIPDAYASTSIKPDLNSWYTLNGSYSECYDPSGSASDSCSWNSPSAGLSVQAMVTGSKMTPTISVTSSANPSVYANPVTFTGSLLNDPESSYVQVFDGSNLLGNAYTYLVNATNLLPYSQQFGNSPWVGYCGSTSNMTVNTSDLSAPDGTTTATKFVLPSTYSCGSGASWGILSSSGLDLQVGQTYTASVWLRGSNGGESVNFGLNDCAQVGVVLTSSWQRYTFTFPNISSSVANCVTGTRGFEATEWNANSTFYIWGAQTEQASSVGPYVATDSSAESGSGYQFTFTTSDLAVGSHPITIWWPSDMDTNTTTSDVFNQVVNPITYDTGSVTLTVGGTSETASYGQNSTGGTIAQSLATAFASDPDVSVHASGSLLTITGTQTGPGSNYPYSLTSTYNSGVFSSPSFYPSTYPNSPSGNLIGGATTEAIPVYSYIGGYDTNGNVLGYTDSVMGTWQFGYDQVNRLVTASNTGLPMPNTLNPAAPSFGPNMCWAYDVFGNRLQQGASDEAFTWGNESCTFNGANIQNTLSSYNNQNQILSTNAPGVSITPSYDAAGDVIGDFNNAYLYDAEGRICAVNTLSSGAVGYLYDASGNRVAKGTITSFSCDITQNGFTQTAGYVVDGGGQQLTEVDASNNWRHTNVWANGKQIGTYDSAGLHFYFDDPLGTRRAQTNSSGVLEAVYQSLPYGDDLVASGPAADPTENHFTGKERDTESGNDYMFARYYNSATGRFLSPDWSAKEEPVPYAKLDDPQTLNLYAYVGNNPVGRADADGHAFGIDDAAEALGYAAVGAAAVVVAYQTTPAGQRSVRNIASGTSEIMGLAMTAAKDTISGWFSKGDKTAPSTPAAPVGATPLPANPEDLKGRGYVETSHPDASSAGHRTFVDPSTGDKVRHDQGTPGAPGHEGEDHYHRYNPNSTGKGDQYLDANGKPVPRGSGPSHLKPQPPDPKPQP